MTKNQGKEEEWIGYLYGESHDRKIYHHLECLFDSIWVLDSLLRLGVEDPVMKAEMKGVRAMLERRVKSIRAELPRKWKEEYLVRKRMREASSERRRNVQ